MKVKAIVFDMDGVLIDAKEWHYVALNRALALFGYDISRHAHETRFDGLPTKTKLDMLSQERCLPPSLHPFINRMKQNYTLQLMNANLRPHADHLNALAQLRTQGYVLAVASNSIRTTIEQMMRISKLDSYLSFILSNEDVRNHKPSPEIYITAMRMAGVTPSECLILEDSPFGLQAARDSGAHVLQIDQVGSVTFGNIRSKIDEIESEGGRADLPFRRAA